MSTYCIEITGDFACFTRPEMKVERVSYDVITPSAARAIFEAILWKPAIHWKITKIEVLNPIRWINLRRNEVGSVISSANVKQVMNGSDKRLEILIEDERQQRAGLFLRDVSYRLHAELELSCSNDSYAKYAEMFKRRAMKGQCFNQPYLGTREFSAHWRYITDPTEERPAIALNQDLSLGWMLYDLDFSSAGNPKPLFYQPTLMKNGSIHVPDRDSEEVRG